MGASRSIQIGRSAVLSLAVLMIFLGASVFVGAALAAAPAAPTGTISTAKPTFTWSKSPGATRYEVRVYKGTTQVLTWIGVAKLSWTSSTALPEAVSLTWRVRAWNASRAGSWSKSLTFKVSTGAIATAADAGAADIQAIIEEHGDLVCELP